MQAWDKVFPSFASAWAGFIGVPSEYRLASDPLSLGAGGALWARITVSELSRNSSQCPWVGGWDLWQLSEKLKYKNLTLLWG